MREVVVFLDEPAEVAVGAAVEFLAERGAELTGRTPLSVAFAGAGQIAAVPVQLKPEWCRVWATAWDSTIAIEHIEAYAAAQRERSRRVEAQVKALESGVYSEASWPAYAERLRASLRSAGTSDEDVERKVSAFKQRWVALGRRAAAAPEEHLSA
ncbi:MAG TPA: hypothetical protein VFN74_19780 [Chloroflexota bacterium]|nr:hypothetical protein [Chloroflexota bacterium]